MWILFYIFGGSRRSGPHPKSLKARMNRRKASKRAVKHQIAHEVRLQKARRRAGLTSSQDGAHHTASGGKTYSIRRGWGQD